MYPLLLNALLLMSFYLCFLKTNYLINIREYVFLFDSSMTGMSKSRKTKKCLFIGHLFHRILLLYWEDLESMDCCSMKLRNLMGENSFIYINIKLMQILYARNQASQCLENFPGGRPFKPIFSQEIWQTLQCIQ